MLEEQGEPKSNIEPIDHRPKSDLSDNCRRRYPGIVRTIDEMGSQGVDRTHKRMPEILQDIRQDIPEVEQHEFMDPGPVQDRLFDENCVYEPNAREIWPTDYHFNCNVSKSRLRHSRGNDANRKLDSP